MTGAMVLSRVALTLFLIGRTFAASDSASVAVHGPSVGALAKVIQMLNTMATKSKEEKQAEEVAFAKFGMWCKAESANLKGDVAKAGEQIEALNAAINKFSTEAKNLGEDIAGLNADVTSFEEDTKKNKEARKKANAEYQATSKDFSESVDALERAIAVMSKQEYDRPASAAVLLQLSGDEQIPEKARSILTAFAGMQVGDASDSSDSSDSSEADEDEDDEPDFADATAPEANAYEFQSGSVVDMLKKLQDDFRTKLGDCQKEEANAAHAYNMVTEDLTDSIENAKKAISEKTQTRGAKQEKVALDKKELASTTNGMTEDEELLAQITGECDMKKASFEEKQQLRGEEIEAIEKAIEVMSSPAVAKPSFSQTDSSVALVQTHTSSYGVRRKARQFLISESNRLKSHELSLLVEKIASDPFAKVKELIDGMLTKLLNEANEDAEHEGFCDTEMGKSKVTRNKLGEDIEGLTAKIDEGKSNILQLAESIATLSKELTDLDSAVGEAEEIRMKEKAENEVVIKDAQAAQAAVQAGTAVLKAFYEKAGEATALVQTGSSQTGIKMGSDEWDALANPAFEGTDGSGTVDKGHKQGQQTFGEKYTGQQDRAGGVMALLEVILSDFANLEADTTAAEETAVEGYKQFAAEAKKTKATKNKQVDMNNADKTKAEKDVQEATKDLKGTQDELLAADRYHEKLVPQCVDQGMTWDERVKAREAEVQSLQEALKILGGDDAESTD